MFKPGDRVYVTDPGLAQLRQIMRRYDPDRSSPPQPNHHGTVEEVWEESVLIHFDDGAGAPYPPEDVRLLSDGGGDD